MLRNLFLPIRPAALMAALIMMPSYVDAQVENPLPATIAEYQTQLRILESRKDDLPVVLLIGDSISIGYTPTVVTALAGRAHVLHNPGNSQGTTHTLENLDDWLTDGKFDLIHFNLGLHDMKRVTTAGTAENSKDPTDPRQADLATYTLKLEKIVRRLKTERVPLVFATTTPVPAGVGGPHRDADDPPRYNAAAVRIMADHEIPVNDLYSYVLPRLDGLQKSRNVHFTEAGSEALGLVVAGKICEALGLPSP